MRYRVLADDGSVYGPADPATLDLWAREGRLRPDTWLEDERGNRLRAFEVPGLVVSSVNPYPVGPGVHPADTEYKSSLALSAISLLGCACNGTVGLIAAAVAVVQAVRARKAGHPHGLAALALAGAALASAILHLVGGFAFGAILRRLLGF